jgi:UDP-N-acetylglucosamine 2-epimerase (non-hydrolysing)
VKKIAIIVGTRPEAIKLIPVYKELVKAKNQEVILISTGQHQEMLNSILNYFGITPQFDLEVMTQNQSLELLSSSLLARCSDVFRKIAPDLVMVQGDTTSSMAAAMAAFYQQIPVAHIEAGLRTYDNLAPFPEEVNRRVISLIAQYHFAPTSVAVSALKREKLPGRIFNVGNTVIDSLLFVKHEVAKRKKYFENLYRKQLQRPFKQMILITGHRRENFGAGFENICNAIRQLACHYSDTSFIYPVHLNPNVRRQVFDILKDLPNVFLIDPIPYDHMVYMMMRCKLILTDSGGIQEEGPSLGKPVIVMRDKTERPEGIKAGCSILAGTSKNRIVRLTKKIIDNPIVYQKMAKAINPYGRGDSSKKICKALSKFLIES